MYHLTERADRVTALREAARVTRPGGLVAVATMLMGSVFEYLDDEAKARVLVESLRVVEREPSLFGASAHLLTAARRPRVSRR